MLLAAGCGWSERAAPPPPVQSKHTPRRSTRALVLVTVVDGDTHVFSGVTLQPDGKIIAAGGSGNPWSGGSFVLARYDVSGALDPSFGSGGLASLLFGSLLTVGLWGGAFLHGVLREALRVLRR